MKGADRLLVSAGVAVLLSSASAAAHHSFAPVYDEQRVITVAGVVTEFRFVNPHATMTMQVTDPKGTVTTWVVEFSGQLNLAEGGWNRESIKPNEHVTVSGNPTHTGSPRLFFRQLVRPDGTVLLPASGQRLNEIEEVRRQRARERSRSK